MRAATSLILGLLAGAGCLSSGTPSDAAPVDVEDGLGDLGEPDTLVADTTVTDTAGDTLAPPDAADTDAADTLHGEDTASVVCSDGEFDPGEACDDGDCDDFVPGAACALDPKIADGYSAGFRFEARAVRVEGQVDGATWCSE